MNSANTFFYNGDVIACPCGCKEKDKRHAIYSDGSNFFVSCPVCLNVFSIEYSDDYKPKTIQGEA